MENCCPLRRLLQCCHSVNVQRHFLLLCLFNFYLCLLPSLSIMTDANPEAHILQMERENVAVVGASPDDPSLDSCIILTKRQKQAAGGALEDQPQRMQQQQKQQQQQQQSLQEAFARFRQGRLELRRLETLASQKTQIDRSLPENMLALRKRFLEQATKYFGVPYHRRYHGPESVHYNAPLYLDCCGLIRKAMDDLAPEFGFHLERWNQCYQFDTLPEVVERLEDLQPGDLIFYEATYYPEKRFKPQKHNLVHVEIYYGGETGEATIGARFQAGVVQIHPSYKFESKNYFDVKHHFRSLNPWLRGSLQVCCPEHSWQRTAPVNASKNSIFAVAAAAAGSDEDGNDAEQFMDD